jgi:TonB-dependent SusC/RagA subfamily outer membrane receptor
MNNLKTNSTLNLQKISIIFLSLIFSFGVSAQELLESRQTSFHTYIYKIKDREAKTIYKKDTWKVDSTFFHTLVDSFPTDSQYCGQLPPGHYLKTYAEKNQQKFSITTIQDFDVFILNNNTDLCVQVYDLQGNIVEDAGVRVRWKMLRFDEKTKAYVDRKSNQKGLLEVTHNGFTAFYNLSREYDNSFIKRGARKVVYGTPLRYVWMPVEYVISLPIDGVKSIVNGWPQGTIYRTKFFFRRSYNKIISWIDGSSVARNNYKFRNKHTGYFVFNKPKYLPGDTVRFKAFLVKKSGKPVDRDVRVILQNRGKDIELTHLAPYHEGGYKYQFFLHDSLQLQLDRDYIITLALNDRKEYISGSFRFEDYELTKNQLSLRIDSKEHFRDKEVRLFAKGTDENELNLMDARMEILVSPKSINKFLEQHSFVPDTLLFFQKKLSPAGETEVVLSDEAFPKANFDYIVNIRMLTSDNEVVTEAKEVSYLYQSEKFEIDVETDSIFFEYLENGLRESKKVKIYSEDGFGNRTSVYDGIVPCRIALNPYFSSYIIETDSLSQSVDVSDEPSLLQCFSERTSDSVKIVVDNPRMIPFLYHIYKKNNRQSYGYADSLNIQKETGTHQSYFVSLRYLWGGAVQEENYKIPLLNKKLNIVVTQPRIVYPGQKSKIDILVTDVDGKPVEGVDLTAYSLTGKFDYSAPQLPYLGKESKGKNIINNFSFNDFDLNNNRGWQLDYDSWKLLAGLDSIEYYRFIYPEDEIYRFEYETGDAKTQFAPFVVDKGEILPVHVIYVDSKPVYFSWSTPKQPYSFRVDSGFHQIKLRTTDREIVLDSIRFEPGKKLIFSLDADLESKDVTGRKVKSQLSDYEKRLLYKYILPYRNNFGDRFATIEQEGEVRLLNTQARYQRRNFAGPLLGNMTYNLVDSFSTTFRHEPFFEYEFLPSLLKMRSVEAKKYPSDLRSYNSSASLGDVVITKETVKKQWIDYLNAKRYQSARYRYPNSTSSGAGRLMINFSDKEESLQDVPLNVLVFRYDNPDFLRVYPGNTFHIHELQKGYHKLLFFYKGARYHFEDSVYVRPDGLNYYEFDQPSAFQKDTFSIYVSNLIEETLFKPRPSYSNEERELKQIFSSYQQQFKYTGVGDVVEGYVSDEVTGEPLPGVNVLIKGTTFGTITNLDGYYSIKVPPGNNVLNFSFIGFVSQDIQIGFNQTINASLTEAALNMDEVVVVGYGVQKKSMLTGAVSTVTSNNLSGSILEASGNITRNLQGRVAGLSFDSNDRFNITIRGVSSPVSFDKKPLFIINGNVYVGDISELDPSVIQNMEVLKGESATAIYGARAANGVVIIETSPGGFKSAVAAKGADYDDSFLQAANQSSSIRDNFSDYAFWQPDLITDEAGEVSFEVEFPDDVTSWETFYLAMNGQKQAGQSEGVIKSYKPLMAQLALPRFLVQNDTSLVIGKVLNYSPDSVEVKTNFEVDGEKKESNLRFFSHSLIDTFSIVAHGDSMEVKYYLETTDGYFDGEKRDIPVFPVGLEEAKGNFYVLDKDTTLSLESDTALGEVSLYARADMLDVLEDEISHLIKYKYSCNEQLASKLKALIAEKNISYYRGEKFRNDNEIDKLIRLLKKNQKSNGLWGWWKNSEERLWISLHVLEALTHAELLGHNISIHKEKITELLIWELESSREIDEKIRILKILSLLEAQVNYQSFIDDLENINNLTLNHLLHIIDLKQRCGLDFELDTLEAYQKTTLFGNVFYSDKEQIISLLSNDVQNTLLAYKIFKAAPAGNEELLGRMRNYFLENRQNGYWRNTYESAQIVETILPDLLGDKSKVSKPELKLTGDITKMVTEFPFEMQIEPSEQVEITKTGGFPVYLTAYQRFWNSQPILKKNDFEISTRFDQGATATLEPGQETKLIARVTAKKDAEYVMISIPVPGGCSYGNKTNNRGIESHREYFRNETTIFCDYLPKGEYTFEIDLIVRYGGTYTVNPAKVELMYFPTFSANNEIKIIRIK